MIKYALTEAFDSIDFEYDQTSWESVVNYPYTIWSDLMQLLQIIVKPGDLPAEFNAELYRLLHPDMEKETDEALLDHYMSHGIFEGRIASPAAHRKGFIKSIPTEDRMLEIGPFTKPAIRGDNVKYFDVLSKQDLKKRAEHLGFPIETEVDIDYLSPNGDLSVVPDASFDGVISSHCIEHQPNLIEHLQNVERILADQGRYYLIIPDKRYCFDHFIPESNVEEILRAHREMRKTHTVKSVYEHWVLTTHTNTVAHWLGHHEDPNAGKRAERAHDTIVKFHEAEGSYIDVHAWQFTPQSFRGIMKKLNEIGKMNMEVERVYSTIWGTYEFMAVLRKI